MKIGKRSVEPRKGSDRWRRERKEEALGNVLDLIILCSCMTI